MNMPKRIDLKPEQIDALLERVKTGSLQDGDYEIIKAMSETIEFLSHLSEEKAASIKRLLRMLFGAKTETAKNVMDPPHKPNTGKNKPEPDQKPKGHGRNGASEYTGATKIKIDHESLQSGDNCPGCLRGKVYTVKIPKVVVRVTGSAPLTATVHELERLRCNLCGEVFTAKAPEGLGGEKYDAASGAMIALLKYGSGLPFNRLAQLQQALGIPLPASTQWGITQDVAQGLVPVYDELIRQAAQGDVVHNDDTTMKILALAAANEKSSRRGMFTTGIVSRIGVTKVALFFTGRKHAGENMDELLSHRESALGPPIQMCDALSRNEPKAFKVILTNCMVHARRNFVDVFPNFPDQCGYVIELLGEVYKNDRLTKEQNMSADQRLQYHQAHSGPLMEELYDWLNEQIDEKKVEPNSGLGKAIAYMLRHWKELTGFLKIPGAGLDNNLCEQALKRAILHRKNSLFYKTQNGAFVGDLFMSLIHTCSLCNVNPFEYLKALQENVSELSASPETWMPWNYPKS